MRLCFVIRVIITVTVSLSLSGCWFSSKSSEPVSKSRPKNIEKSVKVEASTDTAGKTAAKKNLPPDPCIVNDKIPMDPPVFVPGKGIMLTSFLKPCVTREGERGFDKATPWMAMGFPCTGGGGQISTKGASYVHPKMVSFVLSTDCAMAPSTPMEVTMLGREFAGLQEGSKLIAYNPFAVQFWEIPGLKDADTGFTIDLRSNAGLEGFWAKFREGEPARVWLYGRENAWVQGNNIFFIEADLIKTGVRRFKLQIASAKALTVAEIAEVKRRCESLRPRRNCIHVF